MTKFEHYISGSVFGIKYVFDTMDDGLPRHTHDAITAHNICVLRGQVKVQFDDQTVYLRSGDIFDFDGNRPHSVRAITPNACVLNLFLNGQPIEYRGLAPHELKGEFAVRHFIS